jgi:ankyrin repeat protein
MANGEATVAELFAAIRKGDEAVVERLLEKDPRLIEAKDESGLSPLLAALYRGQTEIAEGILGRRPTLTIFEATAAGDLRRTRELVEADRPAANATSPDGFSPLGLAAFFKRRDVVRYLLERGADPAPASRQGGFTPLHSAVATDAGTCDIEIVRALLESGADPNVRSQSGGTPLHTAAFTGDLEVARLLLARGAEPGVKNRDGKTALDIARERGHTAVARLLEERPRGSS